MPPNTDPGVAIADSIDARSRPRWVERRHVAARFASLSREALLCGPLAERAHDGG